MRANRICSLCLHFISFSVFSKQMCLFTDSGPVYTVVFSVFWFKGLYCNHYLDKKTFLRTHFAAFHYLPPKSVKVKNSHVDIQSC